jgi:hypothetical protein
MASMAMMPLIARFVWLLTNKLSAEDLHHQPLSVVRILSTQRNTLLIMNEKRRGNQIVAPGSQQIILSELIRPYQRESRVSAYISTYETSVATCARISISHNQHIPSLYEKGLISKGDPDSASEVQTFNPLIRI